MTRVLIISNDVIGKLMAGPGIRFWEFAIALSRDYRVTLAVPNRNHPISSDFEICTYARDGEKLRELAQGAEAVVLQGFVLHFYPFLGEVDVPVVVDIYDPFVLENIQIHSHKPMYERVSLHRSDLRVLNSQLKAGDFFVCASEKQRDFWIGMLLALNRINPRTYDDDETLRGLIDVVPFGIPSDPPQHTKQVLKGMHKAIRKDDKVILWGGGIWDWFDPCTLIKAMARIATHRDDAKLFFMGIKHPNPLIPRMRATTQAIQLSKKLGLHDRFVFFNDWVPYEERQNYLLEANVGISLHLDHVETRLSFRTRILDYIWAGLPIVTTKGDSMSEMVERYNLGRVVDFEDVEEVTEALLGLLDTPNLRGSLRPNFERVAGLFIWEKAIEPLADFCANPHFAPDKVRQMESIASVKPTPWWDLPGKAWHVFRRRGWSALQREGQSYLRWRFSV